LRAGHTSVELDDRQAAEHAADKVNVVGHAVRDYRGGSQ
jgi:hypothetical protein